MNLTVKKKNEKQIHTLMAKNVWQQDGRHETEILQPWYRT